MNGGSTVMTELPPREGRQPLVPDDDRLLAHVLGLDDDPDLETAAAADEALRSRIDALRAEINVIEGQIRRAVPAPDEEYTDVRRQAWRGLTPYLQPASPASPAEHLRRPKASRRLRILVPAAAALLLALAGGVALQQQNGTAVNVGDNAAPELATPSRADDTVGSVERLPDKPALRHYGVVLVARASIVRDGFQRFDVIRVLRGSAPAVLRLRVQTTPAQAGVLHVLYLAPDDLGRGEAGPGKVEPSLSPGTAASPGSSPPAQASPDPSSPAPYDELLFVDSGRDAIALPLPAEVDPDKVRLP